MLSWSGKGYVTGLLLLLGVFLTQIVVELAMGIKPHELDADLHWAPSFLLAAIMNWRFSIHLEKKPKRIGIEKATGKEFYIDGDDTLLFIGVKKWTVIYLVISVILWIRFILGWD